MTVDVAVIPAAGKGTRMRPATRVLPKALIPVVDRPAIQYVVEEAARAGAIEVILVVDPGVGELLERHFSEEGPLPHLEDTKVTAVTQDERLGLGHAILTAEAAVGDRAFFCLLADNILRPGSDVLPDLSDAAEGHSVVAVRRLSDEWLERYGVVAPGRWLSRTVFEITGAVEKPGAVEAPSNLGLIGRYLFTPEIFEQLGRQEPGHGGEIQVTDAIDRLASGGRCRALATTAELLDMGDPLGLLQASTLLGLVSETYGPAYRAFLLELEDEL
jgi:UTP--glucose-1-phosphate uridylyltransferase